MKTKKRSSAKCVARLRAARLAAGQCVQCGRPSATYRCRACRPRLTRGPLAAVRRAAARARWR